MGVLPMAVFGLEVPAGGMPVAASGDIPAAFRLTMAAIDPSAEPEFDEDTKGKKPRATLKIIRAPLQMEDDEDDSDFDPEEMDMMLASDEEESEEEAGPSDPAKSKKARKAAAAKQLREELESMDVDSPKVKGKGKIQADDEEESDEDDEDEDDEEFEPEEFVLCTLDPENHYQQTLDITVGDDERVWFMVTGTHDVYLTGNYVEPDHTHGPEGEYDSEDEDEDEYDLSPDEDELYGDESEDELDDLENPRVMEIDEEEAETLDDLISKAKPAAEKKNAKKVKTNEGKAVPADEAAKKLETPAAAAKSDKKAAPTVKTVNGVTIDDKKIGSGPAAKKGDRIGMRYIGKLQNGKVFDSNKKGKPFSFKLGTGEVIKGWDIGIAGMQVGGERRVTVPAQHAYGSQSLPGIPKNSTLIFDVKCVEIK
ncbi:hypothetical protein AUEXF2481DRAFT_199779 [Aureobasidium subglaciale EXF-2481]|uniref:FK506-binding protein n=1 Tax=Aureobasidium subglaciale (strain EXF-2481) TaxID=1043005 RepID=A0A074YQ76_AURSE|nr:uncharacterized protein AUEXF2481DRAFT_199779 [Aureobasidium subglaciale EXF-2481]KEQ99850.1 hypothetical protein AUEXF2481DRAFT_199779 [Aureobasidium subglaciale EXF-2481]